MKLVPADLGERWSALIIQQRGGTLDPKEEQRQTLRSAAAGSIALSVGMGLANNNLITGLIAGAAAGVLSLALIPNLRRRQIHETALSPQELSRLRPTKTASLQLSVLDTIFTTLLGQPLPPVPQKHTLEDAYFDLLEEVLPLEVANPEAEAQLKSAVRSLGTATASLPASAPVDESEITDLVADAETLLIRSRREKDAIIAESLHRQAEAAVRRARALQNAAKIARRTKTLREEVYRQIGALRASLPSYSQVSQSISVGRIQELSESVSRVAEDAASVVAAQEELAQTLTPEWRVRTTVEDVQPQIQRLGR